MRDEIAEFRVSERLGFAAPLQAIETISVDNSSGVLSVRATKKIDAADPQLAGHFPGLLIFPGVFIIEGLRQLIALVVGESNGMLPEILTLRSVRFLAPMFPGDFMTLHAIIGSIPVGRSFEVDAYCERDGGVLVARLKAEFGYRGSPGA